MPPSSSSSSASAADGSPKTPSAGNKTQGTRPAASRKSPSRAGAEDDEDDDADLGAKSTRKKAKTPVSEFPVEGAVSIYIYLSELLVAH